MGLDVRKLSSGFANNKSEDRPAHLRRLIRVFVIRILESFIYINFLQVKFQLSSQSLLLSRLVWVSLCWKRDEAQNFKLSLTSLLFTWSNPEFLEDWSDWVDPRLIGVSALRKLVLLVLASYGKSHGAYQTVHPQSRFLRCLCSIHGITSYCRRKLVTVAKHALLYFHK